MHSQSITAAELAQRLDGKRSGAGWMAKCPAHDDHNPSLRISDGRDGFALVHCHGGCTQEAVLAALAAMGIDLSRSGNSHDPAATYEYVDESGKLLFQVCRFLPKGFKQRRPDGGGGWEWNLNGTRRVLYRLPQVMAAVQDGERIWIVEGEKDVAALELRGKVATTNPGGAGKWRTEYSETLRGADVVVVADRDTAGRDHARAIARSLAAVARNVVVVEPAEGKDVSDHLAAGKTLKDLIPIETPPIPQVATGAPQRLTHIRDLLAEPDDAVSWIVDGMLPAGGLSVLAGKPKGGKSTLARAMALRVSRGEPVLGRSTEKGPVVYIGLEDPRRVTKSHFRSLGAEPGDELYVWTGARPTEALAWLSGVLKNVDPMLVVVDTLQHLLGVSDLNDYARVVTALSPVLGLVRERVAHVMLVHHAGKGDRTGFDSILGSTGILGTVDTAVLVKRREDGTRMIATMQRTGDDLPESVLALDEHREPRLEGTRADYDAQQAEEKVLAWLERQTEPVKRDAVLAAVEGRAEAVVAAIGKLVAAGRVVRQGEGVRGSPFLLSIPCSHLYPGTEKQKCQSADNPHDAGTYSVPAGQPLFDSVPSADSNIDEGTASEPEEPAPGALEPGPGLPF